MMIAGPGYLAAATADEHHEHLPVACPYWRGNATNVRFTALSINSIDIKMINALRRTNTPTTPMVNNTAPTIV